MSKKAIVSLNLGSQVISLAVFELSQGELSLLKYASATVAANFDNLALRSSQTKVAIENLVEKVGLKDVRVYCAISNHHGFSKFLRLIQIKSEELSKIVSYEAKQNIPFPLNEVIWSWQHLHTYDDLDEVEIVAVKKDVLTELTQAVSNKALRLESIQLSKTALVNSYYHAYSNHSASTILIDLGALSTGVFYISQKIHFARSLSTGGVDLTKEISKRLNVSFKEAESIKITKGTLILEDRGGDSSAGDEAKLTSEVLTEHYLKIIPE